MMRRREAVGSPAARSRTALGAAAAGLLLAVAAPSPPDALGALRGAGQAQDPTGPLVAAVALLAWSLALWLALTAVLVVSARLPGGSGWLCAALARRLAPATMRRAVELALGLGVAAGVLGAGPASAAPGAPGHPADARPAAASADQDAAGAPGGAPLSTVDALAPGGLDWPGRPPAAGSAPTSAPAPAPVQAQSSGRARIPDRTVVVRPGDTLWGLAERSLRSASRRAPSEAQVAQSWPRWWSANREAVGDDPDLLQPGTRLAPPAGSDTVPPAPRPDRS